MYSHLTRLSLIFLIGFVVLTLTACVQNPIVKNEYAPPKQTVESRARSYNGAIYQDGMFVGLFEDTTARQVGDILTIKLVEQATASAESSTTAEKGQNVDMPPPTVGGGEVTDDGKPVLENKIEAKRDFDGASESEQSHSFNATIAVSVAQVLPNRYLVVRGEKLIVLNQSDEYIRFSGIVRPQDIDRNNSVESTRVADVKVSYAGRGALSSANEMGPLARFFQSPVYPY